MQIDLRVARFQISEQFLVPFEPEARMQSTLHENLIAAQGDRLFDLLIKHFPRENVRVGVRALAIEGAEVANRGADVRVVDVAVDVVSPVLLRMQTAAD